jgi:hypothetical protein
MLQLAYNVHIGDHAMCPRLHHSLWDIFVITFQLWFLVIWLIWPVTTITGGYFAIHISSQTTKKEVSENPHLQTITPRKLLSLCDTITFALVQSQVLHNFRTWYNRKTFTIITASIYSLWLTLHRKLFTTNPSPQRLSKSTQKSIGFRNKIYRKPLAAFWESQQVCVRSYIGNR